MTEDNPREARTRKTERRDVCVECVGGLCMNPNRGLTFSIGPWNERTFSQGGLFKRMVVFHQKPTLRERSTIFVPLITDICRAKTIFFFAGG